MLMLTLVMGQFKYTTAQTMRRSLTGALGDTDGSILIFGIGVGLHLKYLLVIDQSLRTLGHTGSRVVEMAACL